jgi:hypothetical protein
MSIRVVAVVGVWVSAAVHLYLWFDGVRDEAKIGPAFMVNAVGGAVIGLLLLTWRHWVPAFLGLGFGLSTLGAFVVSTTVGLFGVHAGWHGWAAWTAASAEVVVIGTCAWLLVQQSPLLRSRLQSQQHASVGGAHLH